MKIISYSYGPSPKPSSRHWGYISDIHYGGGGLVEMPGVDSRRLAPKFYCTDLGIRCYGVGAKHTYNHKAAKKQMDKKLDIEMEAGSSIEMLAGLIQAAYRDCMQNQQRTKHVIKLLEVMLY